VGICLSAPGFFGMNITSSTPEDFSGLSQLTNSSLAKLSPNSSIETAAIISALGSSGGRTWDLKYYFIFCIPLLLTIPLFLVAGGVFRLAVQSAAKYVVYWRIAIFIVAPLLYVGFYWALPRSAIPGAIAYAILNYGYFGIFAGYRLYHAFSRRRGRRVCGAFAFIVAISCPLDWFILVPYDIPVFSLFPWIFLLCRWIIRDRSS
jgi:hypothetical protein